MTSPRATARDERGIVVVYAAAAGLVLSLVAAVAIQVALATQLRHRAAAAADLAALAASQASVAGRDPCAAARDVARSNGATVVRCRMDVDVATVTARVRHRLLWGQGWSAEQKARAAPVSYLE